MYSHEATDIGIDYQHREAEEGHLIPVEVHLMKQPSQFPSREARDQDILGDRSGYDKRPAGSRETDVKKP